MTIQISTRDPRSMKALAILETAARWQRGHRKADGRPFFVIPSASRPGVAYYADARECNCPDAIHRGVTCVHQLAVRLWLAREKSGVTRPARLSNPLRDAAADEAQVEAILGNLCVECRGPRGTDAIGDRCRACGLGLEEAF